MFDSLSGKLQNAFRNLRGLGKISEANVSDSLREVRMALLEADVALYRAVMAGTATLPAPKVTTPATPAEIKT